MAGTTQKGRQGFVLQHRRPRERELWSLYLRDRLGAAGIAERYGVSENTALGWLRSLGLVDKRRALEAAERPRPEPPRRPRKYQLSALRRRCALYSVSELAAMYDVDRSTIYAWLRREGLTAVDGRRPSHPPLSELQAMRDEGMTLAEIGRRYGVSRQRVFQWLTDA